MKMLMYIEPENDGHCFRILKIKGGRCGKIIADVDKNKIYWKWYNNKIGSDFKSVVARMSKWNQLEKYE